MGMTKGTLRLSHSNQCVSCANVYFRWHSSLFNKSKSICPDWRGARQWQIEEQTRPGLAWYIIEPSHDNINKMTVRLAKTQISLGIHPVWSKHSQCTQWVAEDPRFLHVDSKDSDQTGRMPRLIRVFAGAHAILLVLLWGGYFCLFSLVMSHIMRKCGVQVRLRPACSATDGSKCLWNFRYSNEMYIIYRQWKPKELTRLCECAQAGLRICLHVRTRLGNLFIITY